jgi:hypothetical protein
VGTLTTGFTVLPCFPIVRVYRAEQLSISLRGRRHFAGQWFARAFAGVVAPFLQLYLRVDLKNRKT